VSARIYPERIPESTTESPNIMPLATFTLVDEQDIGTYENKTHYHARVQLEAWGGSYKSAHDVAAALHSALDGYRGAMGDQNVYVGGCFRKGKRDNSAENVELHSVEQVYVINYKEL